jgi:hypothetical protein
LVWGERVEFDPAVGVGDVNALEGGEDVAAGGFGESAFRSKPTSAKRSSTTSNASASCCHRCPSPKISSAIPSMLISA